MEKWCYRKMKKINCTERIAKEEVLRRVGEKRNTMKSWRSRRDKFIWNILKGSSLMKIVLEERIAGKS
jgi:hypothetical protein